MFITSIRNNKKLTTLFILLTASAFAAVPLARAWDYFKIEKPLLANIGGQEVDFNEYKQNYDHALSMAPYQEETKDKKELHSLYAHREALRKAIKKNAIDPVLALLGIGVTGSEKDHLLLKNENLKLQLGDAATGKKATTEEVIQQLKNFSSTERGGEYVRQQQKSDASTRGIQKYFGALVSSYQQTQPEAKAYGALENTTVKVNFSYIPAEASTTVEATGDQMKRYWEAHPNEFQWKDEKKVVYVVLSVDPSALDRENLDKKVAKIQKELKSKKKDPLQVAQRYSDSKELTIEWTEEQIPDLIKAQLKRNSQGDIVKTSQVFVQEDYTATTPKKVLYKLIAIEGNLIQGKKYRFVKIEKELKTTSETHEDYEIEAQKFVNTLTNQKTKTLEGFEEIAEEKGYTSHTRTITKEEAQKVGFPALFRTKTALEHWAYKDGKLNKVSEVIKAGEKTYIVAMIVEEHKKGPKTYEEARPQVRDCVIRDNRKKEIEQALHKKLSKLLNPKGNKIPKSLFKKINTLYPHHNSHVKDLEIDLYTQQLGNNKDATGNFDSAIGQILKLSKKGQSLIIPVENGIIVVQCLEVEVKTDPKDNNREDAENFAGQVLDSYYRMLYDQDKVTDNRFKYYD